MATIQDGINVVSEGFKNIFLAGIGAMALTGEKSKELLDLLVAKGETTVDQGKEINSELTHRMNETVDTVRESALEARMKAMKPEEREAFAARAAEFAAAQNAADAEKATREAQGQKAQVDAKVGAASAVQTDVSASDDAAASNR